MLLPAPCAGPRLAGQFLNERYTAAVLLLDRAPDPRFFLMKPAYKVLILLLITTLYAVIRYNVFGDVAWANVPVYVFNKALSWTGLVLFGMSVVARDKAHRQYYGLRAFAAVLVHVVLSLMILNPRYFDKFFADSGQMTAMAELSMLAGAAGLLFLAGLFYLNGQPRKAEGASLKAGWGRAVLWCGAVHLVAMGYAGWLAPRDWQGYLPPISLLSFLVALFFLYQRAILGKEPPEPR